MVTLTHTFRDDHGPNFVWPALVIICLFLIAAGVVVGLRYLTGDEPMDRPANRIPQLYGYSVCLIAVLVFIFNIQALVASIISASHPLENAYGYGMGSLTSFEAYKATYRYPNGSYVTEDNVRRAAQPTLSDADLQRQYEALRADHLANTRFQTQRDISVSLLMVAISSLLFVLHWRWLRARSTA